MISIFEGVKTQAKISSGHDMPGLLQSFVEAHKAPSEWPDTTFGISLGSQQENRTAYTVIHKLERDESKDTAVIIYGLATIDGKNFNAGGFGRHCYKFKAEYDYVAHTGMMTLNPNGATQVHR